MLCQGLTLITSSQWTDHYLWRHSITKYVKQTKRRHTSLWRHRRYTRHKLVMLGLYRKHWSVTEHRTDVSPIGYRTLTLVM